MLSRKRKTLSAAYPARKPSPLAVRVSCPEIPPVPCDGSDEGVTKSATATPATKPMGTARCIHTKSRGASAFSAIKWVILRKPPIRAPTSANIIGMINELYTAKINVAFCQYVCIILDVRRHLAIRQLI